VPSASTPVSYIASYLRVREYNLCFRVPSTSRLVDSSHNSRTFEAMSPPSSETPSSSNAGGGPRRIPIVCPGHTRPLAELQFCHVRSEEEDRTFLISACHDRMPMVRDGTTGDWIGTFAGHKGAVWSCRLDPSGCLAATASGDFSCQVWDAITGQSLYQLPHKHIVKTCDFSPDSKVLATGGHEGVLRLYDLTAPKKDPTEIRVVDEKEGKKIVICKICWRSDSMVLTGCQDGVIRCWDVNASNAAPTKPSHVLKTDDGAEIRDMEIKRTDDGKEILTVAAGSKVYFFDLADDSLLHVFKMPIHFREEGGASLHPSGTKFVAGGSDLWVRVFDAANGQQLECLKGHHGPIRCLRYSPDGKIFASGSEDGTIRLWKTDPDEEQQ